MTQADSSLAQVAARLLAFEEGSGVDLSAEHGAATVARIHERLHRELSVVVGETGFHAIFARALKLTGAAFPGVGEVSILAPADSALKQLCEHFKTQAHGANAALLAAVVANFVNLLSTFIGAGLTLKLLQNAWPEVLPKDENPSGEKP